MVEENCVDEQPDTSVLAKIKSQIEFYFSDANLARDKFMKALLKDSEWVPLDIFLKFKRISQMTSKVEDIRTAFDNQQDDEGKEDVLLEMDEEKRKIRRVLKFDETSYDAHDRVAYLVGLPEDMTIDQLLSFVNENVENVCFVRMLRKNDKFEGISLVEFKTREDAEKAKTKTLRLDNEEFRFVDKKPKEDFSKKALKFTAESTIQKHKIKAALAKVIDVEFFVYMISESNDGYLIFKETFDVDKFLKENETFAVEVEEREANETAKAEEELVQLRLSKIEAEKDYEILASIPKANNNNKKNNNNGKRKGKPKHDNPRIKNKRQRKEKDENEDNGAVVEVKEEEASKVVEVTE